MKDFLFIFILPFVLTGLICSCTKEPTEITQDNEYSFEHPFTVGTLPDGRVIQRVIYQPTNGGYANAIYFVGSTITLNQERLEGKVTHVETTVLVDGVKYVPAEKEIVDKKPNNQ